MTTSMTPTASTTYAGVEAWVLDHLRRCQEPGTLGLEDVAQVAVRPGGRHVACSVVVRAAPLAPLCRRVAIVPLDSGEAPLRGLAGRDVPRPAWAPDGSRLTVVRSAEGGAAAVVLAGEPSTLEVVAESDLPGFVESAAWSPDGSRLALQVAMPGAEISDVHGSGTLGSADAEAWRPRVLPGEGAGRRLAYVWDPRTGDAEVVCEQTVWELAWNGDAALLALATEEPDENAWYGAVLIRVDLHQDGHETLLVPDDQLSVPRSSPAGRRWSVLSGLQSDRGLPAGVLLVSRDGAPALAVDTRGVHVTDQHWLDETTVLVAGLRGLETVVAIVDADSGSVIEQWHGQATCGEYFPEVAGLAGGPFVVVRESSEQPPTLGVLEPDGFRPVLSTEGPGATYQEACAGTTTPVDWVSSDGLEIQGLLTVPHTGPDAGPVAGPYPLVLQVHGGPTHAVRGTWAGRDPLTSCLVARGYAVLRPNPRGSTGRGAAFAEAVRGDMGGLDVDDLVTGVRAMVDRGVADPARLGITGISYGGFMASWVPTRTEVFAASAARSPCTDWLLQHLTSNIAEFDRRFLPREPVHPAPPYAGRRPPRRGGDIPTPAPLPAGQRDLATPPPPAPGRPP